MTKPSLDQMQCLSWYLPHAGITIKGSAPPLGPLAKAAPLPEVEVEVPPLLLMEVVPPPLELALLPPLKEPGPKAAEILHRTSQNFCLKHDSQSILVPYVLLRNARSMYTRPRNCTGTGHHLRKSTVLCDAATTAHEVHSAVSILTLHGGLRCPQEHCVHCGRQPRTEPRFRISVPAGDSGGDLNNHISKVSTSALLRTGAVEDALHLQAAAPLGRGGRDG